MRATLFELLIVLPFIATAAQPEAYVIEGNWVMNYSASEDMHKLMFSLPDSYHSNLAFFCSPQSKIVTFIFEAPETDIRTYQPNVRTETVVSPKNFEIEFNDLMSVYRVSQDYDPDSHFLQSLVVGDDLFVEESRYVLSEPEDSRLFREFFRACGGEL